MPYTTDWKDVKEEVEGWACRVCKHVDVVEYRKWESSDGGREDLEYHCKSCNRQWWVEGTDY